MTVLHLTKEHYEVLGWVARQTTPAPLKDEHEKPLKALVDAGLVDLDLYPFRGFLPKLTKTGMAVLIAHLQEKIKASFWEAKVELLWDRTLSEGEACHEFARAQGFVWPSGRKAGVLNSLFEFIAGLGPAMRPQPPQAPPPPKPNPENSCTTAYSNGFKAGLEKGKRDHRLSCCVRSTSEVKALRDVVRLTKELDDANVCLDANRKEVTKLSGEANDQQAKIRDLLRAKDALKDMLKRVEWGVSREIKTGFFAFTDPCCPICGNPKDKGHDKACVLGECLKSEGDCTTRFTGVDDLLARFSRPFDTRPWITPGQWDMLVKVLGEVQVKNNFRRSGDGKP